MVMQLVAVINVGYSMVMAPVLVRILVMAVPGHTIFPGWNSSQAKLYDPDWGIVIVVSNQQIMVPAWQWMVSDSRR